MIAATADEEQAQVELPILVRFHRFVLFLWLAPNSPLCRSDFLDDCVALPSCHQTVSCRRTFHYLQGFDELYTSNLSKVAPTMPAQGHYALATIRSLWTEGGEDLEAYSIYLTRVEAVVHIIR